MKDIFKLTAVCFAGVLTAQAYAAEPQKTVDVKAQTAAEAAGMSELDSLRAKNALLTEQVKTAGLHKQLLDSGTSRFPIEVAITTAQVEMVSGVGENLIAKIALSGGYKINVKVGGKIPGVGTVESISISDVMIKNGKLSSVSLPFATDAGDVVNVAGAGNVPSMPPSFMPPASMPMSNPIPVR